MITVCVNFSCTIIIITLNGFQIFDELITHNCVGIKYNIIMFKIKILLSVHSCSNVFHRKWYFIIEIKLFIYINNFRYINYKFIFYILYFYIHVSDNDFDNVHFL